MKIGFGNDYTGIELKNTLMKHLKEKGYECIDYGTSVEADKQDYTLPGLVVAEAILNKQVDKGVLICGTGIGISRFARGRPRTNGRTEPRHRPRSDRQRPAVRGRG